ncbi:hypothetical protein [Tenacibaculum ascidiaceicola]|uniref:hypothetical protein n=1 Tax=Tenacibaculum ascidiaceicola TaxID=1699411 RepID=UPI0038944BE9
MKQLLLITLTIVFTSCNAQKITTMKKFDIEKFNKYKDTIRNEYYHVLGDGTIVEQMELKEVFAETIKQKESFFEVKNQYYKNGNLKITGKYFNSSFQKGIWREYDEKGNLIKETNYDKGYNYTWEDLLKLLKEREVNVRDTNNTTIRKDDGEWWVYYVKGLYIYNIRINGKTGKITLDDKDIFEEGS